MLHPYRIKGDGTIMHAWKMNCEILKKLLFVFIYQRTFIFHVVFVIRHIE